MLPFHNHQRNSRENYANGCCQKPTSRVFSMFFHDMNSKEESKSENFFFLNGKYITAPRVVVVVWLKGDACSSIIY